MILEFLQPLMVSHDKPGQKCLMSQFTSEKCPSMNIEEYIIRIIKYFRSASMSKGAMVGAAIMLKRVVQCDNNVELSAMTAHRLILTSFVISSKFTEDLVETNSYYARVGGIEARELIALEWEFLRAIEFALIVSPKEFQLTAAAMNLMMQRKDLQQEMANLVDGDGTPARYLAVRGVNDTIAKRKIQSDSEPSAKLKSNVPAKLIKPVRANAEIESWVEIESQLPSLGWGIDATQSRDTLVTNLTVCCRCQLAFA